MYNLTLINEETMKELWDVRLEDIPRMVKLFEADYGRVSIVEWREAEPTSGN